MAASTTTAFTAAALRAALRRRMAASGQDDGVPSWSEADQELARAVCAALAADPQLVFDLPAAAAAVDGLPELDWGCLSLDEIAGGVRDRAHAGQPGTTATGGPGARPAGTTVRDEGAPDALSFEAFMASRVRQRAEDAQALLAQRERFAAEAKQLREDHYRAAEGLFDDPSMPRDVRAQAVRHQRDVLRRALAEHALERREALAARPWYGSMVERWTAQRGDRADYAHALSELYGDRLAARRAGGDQAALATDPVLVAIPGARRYRDAGTLVYARRTPAGPREMFRVVPDERQVIVRSHNEADLEAAVMTAHRLDGPPLAFVGSPAFRARCAEVAERHGYDVVQAAQPREPLREPAVAPASARVTTPPPNAGNSAPARVDLSEYAESVEAIKQQTGIELVVALDPKHGVTMNPVYQGHIAMRNGALDLVFTQCPGADAIGAIVLPRDTVPADAVEGVTRLTLEVRGGVWEATFEATEELHVDEPGPVQAVSRGR
jgi:hypothetical protein